MLKTERGKKGKIQEGKKQPMTGNIKRGRRGGIRMMMNIKNERRKPSIDIKNK